MKILLLCGNHPNQIALANKVAARFNLVGIVAEEKTSKRRYSISTILSALENRLVFWKIRKGWMDLMNFYKLNYFGFPASKIIVTSDINSDEVIECIKSLSPDLIMVSGTSLIKGRILSFSPAVPIVNLHTGLSPYIKGGPNCTNWCISRGEFHLIGNTIMWLDKGIDSGNIILSDLTEFSGEESFFEIHRKVMDHAHALYLKALESIALNRSSVASVAQHSIAEGNLFYTKNWNFSAKWKLLRNLKKFRNEINSKEVQEKRKQLILVK